MNGLEESQRILEDSAGEYDKFLDKIIKANREIIVLSILIDKPMCGYDLIKEVFAKSQVFLGQGTVYPILYSLEEEGLLRAEFGRGNMRSKRYHITPEGKLVVEMKLKSFVRALSYVSNLVQGEKDD
jgi:PadR family transcriptional regulator PadR